MVGDNEQAEEDVHMVVVVEQKEKEERLLLECPPVKKHVAVGGWGAA